MRSTFVGVDIYVMLMHIMAMYKHRVKLISLVVKNTPSYMCV